MTSRRAPLGDGKIYGPVSQAARRLEREASEASRLRAVVREAAAREHGVGYGSKRNGRRCNLDHVYGCIYCRALAGLFDD